jgi:hypothetical protein
VCDAVEGEGGDGYPCRKAKNGYIGFGVVAVDGKASGRFHIYIGVYGGVVNCVVIEARHDGGPGCGKMG